MNAFLVLSENFEKQVVQLYAELFSPKFRVCNALSFIDLWKRSVALTVSVLKLAVRSGCMFGPVILGAFVKLRKATIGFIFVRPHGTARFLLHGF
jgi:hypothetical protein